MSKRNYGLFCPISKACEVLEPRWTLLVLAEMFCGASRFNEIKRGLPGVSPTLLSRRLKGMERDGLVIRSENKGTGTVGYTITRMAQELYPVVLAMGKWSLKHIATSVEQTDLDSDLLMWNLRRNLDADSFTRPRVVVKITFPEEPEARRDFWLIARKAAGVELCKTDPNLEVDLYIEADLGALTSIFLGHSTIRREIDLGTLFLSGDSQLEKTAHVWMRQIPFAR